MYNLKSTLAYAILLMAIIITSCKSHALVPGFAIGMSTEEFTSSIKAKVANGEFMKSDDNDTLHFIHQMRLKDTSIWTNVSFNHDGIPYGNLRICVIDLTDSVKVIDVPESIDVAAAKEVPEDEMLHGRLGPESTRIVYTTCPMVKFTKSLLYLNDLYGKEDSITYMIYLNSNTMAFDTTYTLYHFHDSKSNIVLRRKKVLPPSFYIPYSHTKRAQIYQVSKNYEKEFQQVKEEKRKKLRPSDIIRVPVEYTIVSNKNDYGSEDVNLELTTNIYLSDRITLIESREINSMKGKVIISDTYGQVLKICENIEYNIEGLNSVKPGLTYALGGEPILTNSISYKAHLSVIPSRNPQELKDAVRNNRKLSIEFVPDALIFSDGSILN